MSINDNMIQKNPTNSSHSGVEFKNNIISIKGKHINKNISAKAIGEYHIFFFTIFFFVFKVLILFPAISIPEIVPSNTIAPITLGI